MRKPVTTILALGLVLIASTSKAEIAIETRHIFSGTSAKASLEPICEQAPLTLVQTSHLLSAQMTDEEANLCDEETEFQFPSVQRSTHFQIETSNGEILRNYIIYPDNLLEPIATWSQSNLLKVSDSNGKLENVLEENGILYEAMYDKTLTEPQAKMIFGDSNPYEILFMEESSYLPKIVIDNTKAVIEMPFLEDLKTNPIKQVELVNLFTKLTSRKVVPQ